MNIWDADKLVLLIAFVIPGFISIKTYDLLVPSERRKVGKSLVNDEFVRPLERSHGAIISASEIKFIRLYR